MGLPTTATILFGHIEDEIHTSEHLEVIKAIQKATHGISAVTLGTAGQFAGLRPKGRHSLLVRLLAFCRPHVPPRSGYPASAVGRRTGRGTKLIHRKERISNGLISVKPPGGLISNGLTNDGWTP